MIPITRRAPSALRAFLVASPARSITRAVPRSQLVSAHQRCLPQTTRYFSSIPSRFQQAVAENDMAQDSGTNELSTFEDLADRGLISRKVIDTLTKKMNIHTMTDVQKMTLNHCLDGSDVIAQARTGTGKTLAFLMPIVQRILREKRLEVGDHRQRASAGDIRALIISPTRELAEQIAVEAKKLVSDTAVKVQTAVGGTQKGEHLRRMRQEGCHILVGTPGRILDILTDRSTGVSLQNIQTFVLDEADRLLDIGFAPAIADIQAEMPSRAQHQRQTLMFSATVPKSVVQLVRETLRPDFKFIRTVDPDEAPTHERIPQNVVFGQGLQNQIPIVMEIAHNAMQAHQKDPVNNMPFKAIVYFGSTAEVQMTYDAFSKMRDPDQQRGIFTPHPLDPCRLFHMHGKLAQAQRTRETQGFRNAQSALLFSSDVTARGMDFPNVSHIIQIGLPKNADDYVHRLGRTGRAGKSGEGWLILNSDERRDVDAKMRNTRINLIEGDLVTASLDMTRGAQIPSHIAKLLKYVEVGVKSVPFATKAATYQALLGVLAQQNPNRSKQAQIDMMNQLAKYGWGMSDPPGISQRLADKIGFGRVSGLNVQSDRGDRGFGGRDGGRGGFGGRDSGRGGPSRRESFDERDPFGQGLTGRGVGAAGGEGGDDAFRSSSSSSSSSGGRGGFGGRDRDGGSRGGFGGRDARRGGGLGGRGGGYGGGRDGGRSGGYGGRDSGRGGY